MAAIALTAEIRKERGKGAAGRARRSGRVPGIIYGRKSEPVLVTLDSGEFVKAMMRRETGERRITLAIAGESAARDLILQEVQQDPVSYAPLHVDFVLAEVSGGDA